MVRLSAVFLLWIGAPILGVRHTLGVRHVITESYDQDVVIQQTSRKPNGMDTLFRLNPELARIRRTRKRAKNPKDLKRRKPVSQDVNRDASPSVTHPKPALNIGDRSGQQAVEQDVTPSLGNDDRSAQKTVTQDVTSSVTPSIPSLRSDALSAQQAVDDVGDVGDVTVTQDVTSSVTPSIPSLRSDALSAQQVVGPTAGGPFVYKVKKGWVAACTGVEDWRCAACIKDGKLRGEADKPEKDKTCRQGVQKIAYDHGTLGFLDTCDTGNFQMSTRNKKLCDECLKGMAGFIKYVTNKYGGTVKFLNKCKKTWFPKS